MKSNFIESSFIIGIEALYKYLWKKNIAQTSVKVTIHNKNCTSISLFLYAVFFYPHPEPYHGGHKLFASNGLRCSYKTSNIIFMVVCFKCLLPRVGFISVHRGAMYNLLALICFISCGKIERERAKRVKCMSCHCIGSEKLSIMVFRRRFLGPAPASISVLKIKFVRFN